LCAVVMEEWQSG